MRVTNILSLVTIPLALVSCGPPAGGQGAAEAVACEPPPPGAFAHVDLSGLPDFTLERHDGMGEVNLHQQVRQNVVAISFWATWCDACQVELPQLENLYRKYRSAGFVVLAISMDTAETVAEVHANVEKLGLTYPVLLDTESQATGAFNPRMAAPLFILIDRTGKQVYSHESFVVSDLAEMEEQIVKALACQ